MLLSEIFLSTLSLRRATPVVAVSSLTVYFYPRSPCGERQKLILQFLSLLRISIHALLAESDSIDNSEISDNLTFLSTLSLRRATRNIADAVKHVQISIHALLAESDNCGCIRYNSQYPFLSTLSLRRATTGYMDRVPINHNFYPRSPCGERPRKS